MTPDEEEAMRILIDELDATIVTRPSTVGLHVEAGVSAVAPAYEQLGMAA